MTDAVTLTVNVKIAKSFPLSSTDTGTLFLADGHKTIASKAFNPSEAPIEISFTVAVGTQYNAWVKIGIIESDPETLLILSNQGFPQITIILGSD